MKNLTDLQFQQARLNQLIENCTKQIAVVFEGRDSAGKSFSIREITHYLPIPFFRIEPSRMPSKRTMAAWLKFWKNKMPRDLERIVFYDRSWYSRALLQPINGWCSEKQYRNFISKVCEFEEKQNVVFIKFWLSISEIEQYGRLTHREFSPLKYWKFGANDRKALSGYDQMTLRKEALFNLPGQKWNSVDYNCKSAGILKLLTRLNDILEKKL